MATNTLNRLSAVHRGVAFEKRALSVLQSQLSMSLQKTGGKSDGGIDLQGWWWLPPSKRDPVSPATWKGTDGIARRRLRVIGQCKAEKKKMSPNYVRELEGVLGRHDSRQPTVGLLISQSPFTRSTVLRAFSSSIPLFLLHLPPEADDAVDGEGSAEGGSHKAPAGIGSAVWNAALGSEQGLLAGEFEARWEWSLNTGGGRPGLWWNGEKLGGWVPPAIILDEHLAQTDFQ
ncbi:hypothetical protein K439DRAFT_1333444 [Ramaria rubella]|nr:hypothetical protein K439DRAFT_1333444 [Ramaria rubella]